MVDYLSIGLCEIWVDIVFDEDKAYNEIVASVVLFLIFLNHLAEFVFLEVVFDQLMINFAIILVPDSLIRSSSNFTLLRDLRLS